MIDNNASGWSADGQEVIYVMIVVPSASIYANMGVIQHVDCLHSPFVTVS